MHNMAADDMIANHITLRNGVCQYVRRVPEDLRDAFPFARVQKSLGTRDKRAARQAALALDQEWDRRFAEARRRRGLATDAAGDLAAIDTTRWTWPDWEALARWFEATLIEEDWRARLSLVQGRLFTSEADLSALPWREDAVVKEHINRGRALSAMAVATYAEDRFSFVQSHVRGLGVSLSRTMDYFERFMAACLTAELAYLEVFRLRESRKGGIRQVHPDAITGPWRRVSSESSNVVPLSAPPAPAPGSPSTRVGKTLADCRAKWIENRDKVKKQVRPEYLREMDQTIALFQAHAGVTDIGEIRRRHVLAYRDHLGSATDYKFQTINKKIGFISSLMSTGLNAGWTETSLGGDLFLEVPEDEDHREPYSAEHIDAIFAHPIFTAGHRFKRAKACGELQFWLPLIACLHGMISSEILQLGPDTVMPHPDAPDLLCFVVTNAGDRRVKSLARKRWVPIRRELLDLGLSELLDAACAEKRRFIWPAMTQHGENVTRVSGYFSSFWASFTRKELEIEAEGTSLYSFRHAFQDRLSQAGRPDEVKKALMGHTEGGMTGRYGTKKKPRVVNIAEINDAVQSLSWPFLSLVRGV
ncbi:MAG: DUF6538 domain-containing protein [Salinarimonas sp.]